MPQWDSCCGCECRVKEAWACVSPHAGGYLCASCAPKFSDCLETRAEVLYGLSKLNQIEEPPPNLKKSLETQAVLMQFWRSIVEIPLPACENAVSLLVK